MIGLLLLAAVLAWPDLPTEGFLGGRVATDADVMAGRAVFAQGGAPGQASPLPLTIPQYACWTSEDAGRQRMVLVQAEHGPPGDIVGLRTARGEEIVATLPEVRLLGQQRPGEEVCP